MRAGALGALACWVVACAPSRTVSGTPEGVTSGTVAASPQSAPPLVVSGPERGLGEAGAEQSPPQSPPSGSAPRGLVLPPSVAVGEAQALEVPGDREVQVVHAPAGVSRAIVYLHGVCGNIHAMQEFAPRAHTLGTLVALFGDEPCADRPGRFRWGTDAMQIHQRIQRALAAVREARGGVLQQNDVVLFGYSQGASRAEALVARYPEQYRWVVLGGPPLRPTVAALQHAASVVVFGGERENTAQMSRGARDLSAAGVRSRYFEIPGATHGQFGASGNAVIGDALRWLLAAEGPGAPTSSGPRGGASEL